VLTRQCAVKSNLSPLDDLVLPLMLQSLLTHIAAFRSLKSIQFELEADAVVYLKLLYALRRNGTLTNIELAEDYFDNDDEKEVLWLICERNKDLPSVTHQCLWTVVPQLLCGLV